MDVISMGLFYTLKPQQNGRHFANIISKCNSLTEDVWILMEMLVKFVLWDLFANNFVVIAWY